MRDGTLPDLLASALLAFKYSASAQKDTPSFRELTTSEFWTSDRVFVVTNKRALNRTQGLNAVPDFQSLARAEKRGRDPVPFYRKIAVNLLWIK
jgi:hypothetical protein